MIIDNIDKYFDKDIHKKVLKKYSSEGIKKLVKENVRDRFGLDQISQVNLGSNLQVFPSKFSDKQRITQIIFCLFSKFSFLLFSPVSQMNSVTTTTLNIFP